MKCLICIDNRKREFEGTVEEAKDWLEERGDHMGIVEWRVIGDQYVANVVIADYVFGPYGEVWTVETC